MNFSQKNSFKISAIIFIVIICLAPFVNKAFHIDDTLFLRAAEQIRSNPLDFYGFNINWYGWELPMSKITKNPPLTCYFIALVSKLFGWSEAALHIAFLIPNIALAIGVYYLAKEFCNQPFIAAIVSVFTPAFLLSGTTVMCDMMMLAFWVWAVVLWIYGLERGKYYLLIGSAFLVSFCALTKYFGICLIPLLFIYSLTLKRKFGFWALFILIPIINLSLYEMYTKKIYGVGLLFDAMSYSQEHSTSVDSNFIVQCFTGLIYTGGGFITALFFVPLIWSRRVIVFGSLFPIGIVTILYFIPTVGDFSLVGNDGLRWNMILQIVLLATSGLSVICFTVFEIWKKRDSKSLFLFLWIIGTFIFAAIVNWTTNIRAVLPLIPAASIILVRMVENVQGVVKLKKLNYIWLLIPCIIVSLSVTWADYTLANSARHAAKYVSQKFNASNRKIWFVGHWGFQYYMELRGGYQIDKNGSDLNPGKCLQTTQILLIFPANRMIVWKKAR